MSYSQGDEEKFILEYFEDFKGRFLEIGSYSPEVFSNTRALVLNGWSGVMIEPEPASFIGISNFYKDNPNIECVNAALGTKRELIKFYDSNGGAISTTSDSHMRKWKEQTSYRKIWVNTITIQDIYDTFGDEFDFISLDVEGTNWELLQTINLEKVRLLCIEHDEKIPEILEYAQGFTEIYRNGENLILGR